MTSRLLPSLPPAPPRALKKYWQGKPLQKVLLSARCEGEKILHLYQEDAARLSEHQDASAKDALQLVEQARIEIEDAWEVLIQKVVHALRRETLAGEITPLLEDYYRDINLRFQALAEHEVWPELEKDEKKKSTKTTDGDEVARSIDYPVHTSQEWLALLHTASDGKYGRHFFSDENRGVLRHQRPNAPFFTETVLSDEERRMSLGIDLLSKAAGELDLDDCFIWLYISDLIAPAGPLQAGNYAGGWIDLNDVARKTLGGYAPNPEEAHKRRRKVWHAIRYGARAFVGGQRSVPYFDKASGKKIETEIYTTPWQVVSRQQPVQPSLFPDEEEGVPTSVELVASREWTTLTTSPNTAQFLPLGEMLGAIPPSQPSGAWARALGLAYMHWCRLHLQEALDGKAPPSRRHLLEQFPTKTAPFDGILESDDPGRALKYWNGAEVYLREIGFIEGNASRPPRARKGWKEPWLGQSPAWRPGPHLRVLLEALALNRLPSKPRSLKRPKRSQKKAD